MNVESRFLWGKFYSRDTRNRGRKAGFAWKRAVKFANFLPLKKRR